MIEQDQERFEIQDQAITEPPAPEMEAKPTEAGQQAAVDAVSDIRSRSYSGRHPELGKMIKCQICGRRHRQIQELRGHTETDGVKKASKLIGTIGCIQQFATGKYDIRDPKPLLVAGETPETKPDDIHSPIKIILGAAGFKGRRIKPPLNKRTNQFVQLVHSLIPDEYTKEELEKARNKAKRVLAKKFGRFGFLPPIWQKLKRNNENQSA